MSILGSVVGSAYVVIRPDTSTFSKDLAAGVDRSVRSVSASQNAVVSFGGAVAKGLAIGSVAAVDFGAKLQAARAQLEAADRSTGVPFSALAKQTADVEQQMTAFGVTNAQTDQGLARLTATTGNALVALKAYPAVVETARATNHTLTQELKDFTDASQGNYSALERTGIVTKEQVKNFHSFGDAVDYITKKFGPLAQAQEQSFQGQLSKDKAVAINDLAAAGEKLIPVVEAVGHGFVDVSNFLRENKPLAEDLAVTVGGVLTAAVAAYTYAAGKAVLVKIGDAWKDLRSVGAVLTGTTRDQTAATETQAGAQETQRASTVATTEAVQAQSVALEELTQVVSVLVAPLTDLSATMQAWVAAEERAALGGGTFAEAVIAQRAEVEALRAEFATLAASAAAPTPELEALGAAIAQLSVAEREAIASGEGLSEEFSTWVAATGEARASLEALKAELISLDGEIAVTEADMAEMATTAESSTATAGLAFGGLATKIGVATIALVGLQEAEAKTGQFAQQSANPFVQAENQKISALGSTSAKIKQVQADLAAASASTDRLARNTQNPSGWHETFQAVVSAIPVLGTLNGTINNVIASTDGGAAKIKALKQVLADLQAQAQATGAAVGGTALYWQTLAAAQQQVADATTKNEAAQEKLDAAANTYANDQQRIIDAKQTLADAYQTEASDALTLRQEQQQVNDIMSRSGQYAIDLASSYNRLSSDATSLLSAQVNLNLATKRWNEIQTDTGTYLEDQRKAQLALAQAELQATQAAQAQVKAQRDLQNLITNNQAAIAAYNEAHGNLLLAQELANIQAGDSVANNDALQQAQNNVASSAIAVGQANLAVTDAQTQLNSINNEAIAGTNEYNQALDTLQQAQEGVAGALNQQKNDQLAYNNLLAESIPGTLQYQQVMNQLSRDTYAYDTAVTNIGRDQRAVDSAIADSAKAFYQLGQAYEAAAGPATALAIAQAQLELLSGQTVTLLNALFGGGTGGGNPLPPTRISAYAAGGAIGAGEVGLVGEHGPELFVSKEAGNIIPSNAISASSGGPGISLSIADINHLGQIEGGMQQALLTLAAAMSTKHSQDITLRLELTLNGVATNDQLGAAVAAHVQPALAEVLTGILSGAS